MSRLLIAALLHISLSMAAPAAAALPGERLAELVAIDYGEIANLVGSDSPGLPEGLAEVPKLVAPFKAKLGPFMKDPPDLGADGFVPPFVPGAKFNALRHATKGLSGVALWLAAKGKHAEAYRLLRHAGALSLFVARGAARPWQGDAPGGTLIAAMISIAMRGIVARAAGKILVFTAPPPALARAFAEDFAAMERGCPELAASLRSECDFARRGLAVLAAADPARPHSAWLAEVAGGDANPFFPPGFEKAIAEAVSRSPEARAVWDLQIEDASREIALYEARIASLAGKRYKEAEPIFDALDADFMKRRFRNLYVQIVTPNVQRAMRQMYRHRACVDLLVIASSIAGSPPPQALPAEAAKLNDALGDGSYRYIREGDRFMLFSASGGEALRAAAEEQFRLGEPDTQVIPERVAWRSDQGFLP